MEAKFDHLSVNYECSECQSKIPGDDRVYVLYSETVGKGNGICRKCMEILRDCLNEILPEVKADPSMNAIRRHEISKVALDIASMSLLLQRDDMTPAMIGVVARAIRYASDEIERLSQAMQEDK